MKIKLFLWIFTSLILISTLPSPLQAGSPDDFEFDVCRQVESGLHGECYACTGGDIDNPPDPPQGIWTAIGCIPTDQTQIAATFIRFFVGIGGVFGVFFLIYGSFLYISSQGNPEKTQQARQILTSTLGGLIFIITSVIIYQLLGVTILRLPGLT